jgi:membrane protease YdiL (CAAX protease family)
LIRFDSLSKAFAVLAIMLAIYLSTFQTGFTELWWPVLLILSGLLMHFLWLGRIEEVDSLAEPETASKILIYTSVAVLTIAVTGIFITAAKIPAQFTGVNAILFSILMAVSEEIFFRGFITNMLASASKVSPVAILASGLIFAVYHFARYGTSPASILYVFVAGVILSWVAWHSGRLSPVICAHVLNNLVAVGGIP